jgi:thymidylate synthase (FAD)
MVIPGDNRSIFAGVGWSSLDTKHVQYIMSVELLDVFGDDLTVVNAARVSFAKESNELSSGDVKLVKYLADHNHVTPFFHPQARFRLKMPIFVAREWFRHQIGFARNEVSRRYVDNDPEFWMPTVLRERDTNKKQGSKDTEVQYNGHCLAKMELHNDASLALYKDLMKHGVCPEQARAVLPQSMMTEFIETGSLAAYARLYKLRTDPTAQREIQELAGQVGELLAKRFPVSWNALTC